MGLNTNGLNWGGLEKFMIKYENVLWNLNKLVSKFCLDFYLYFAMFLYLIIGFAHLIIERVLVNLFTTDLKCFFRFTNSTLSCALLDTWVYQFKGFHKVEPCPFTQGIPLKICKVWWKIIYILIYIHWLLYPELHIGIIFW